MTQHQGSLIRGAKLWCHSSVELDQWIGGQRFGEIAHATGFQHPVQFRQSLHEIKVMDDGKAHCDVKGLRLVYERLSGHHLDAAAIEKALRSQHASGVLRRLGRNVESAHLAAHPRQIPRDPSFSAAVLQNALAMQIAQAGAQLRVDILRWPGGIMPRIQVSTAVLGIVELRLALEASLE